MLARCLLSQSYEQGCAAIAELVTVRKQVESNKASITVRTRRRADHLMVTFLAKLMPVPGN